MSTGQAGAGWPHGRDLAPEIARLAALLADSHPGSRLEVDAPDDPQGEWWLDVTIGAFSTAIAWRPALGFGLYGEDDAYGTGPEEIYRTPDMVAARLGQILAHWRRQEDTRLTLKDARALSGASQVAVAHRLSINQGAVSRLESRNDVKISSLAAYVSALGGELELRVKFDGFSAPLAIAKAPDLDADAGE
ncbi:hypothetical protein ACM64Y_08340 [Novispirillum sp. DQ9]|uniref:helix-turn-helix domain-containing protein n=1 Tax=Novispirillum sp. DQ9 TaxID=3398612 RepID=UPI003C7DC927